MARVQYELTRRGTVTVFDSSVRYTGDAAKGKFLAMVYDMIAARGQLDTAYGKALWERAKAFAFKPPKRGYTQAWKLGHDTGDHSVDVLALRP